MAPDGADGEAALAIRPDGSRIRPDAADGGAAAERGGLVASLARFMTSTCIASRVY